jgi:oxygen-independent coproporphyrinogen-3 oxidase
MSAPQRHRLLQGFPMPKAMRPVTDEDRWDELTISSRRWNQKVLVGVLPHPFCVPEVRGCGFCTFPHEQHKKNLMLPLATAIARELGTHKGRDVSHATALYFGGGTANLVTDEALQILVTALAARFGTGADEVTLEGVPRFFRDSQLDLLEVLGAKRVRLSMGVQTFDDEWLQKMGRTKIGSAEHVEQAQHLASERGAQTSCDLLINLPGQSVDEMLRDVEHAAELGFDQICIYHLVLFDGLDTEWAKDPQMLDALPDNERAFESWRAVRTRVLELGYRQSTLTNFEREALSQEARFAYEPLSFAADKSCAIGVGPGAISGNGHARPGATKWINPVDASAYLEASTRGGGAVRPALAYSFDRHEDVLAQLTRGLANLSVERGGYGLPLSMLELFEPELSVLTDAGLLDGESVDIVPTERGMFYADSIAGLLAHRAMLHRRAKGHVELENDAPHLHMG